MRGQGQEIPVCAILYDPDTGNYYFEPGGEWVGERQPPGCYAATVTCDIGHIEVVGEKLVHFVQGDGDKYDAEWLVKNASSPPAGLKVEVHEGGSP